MNGLNIKLFVRQEKKRQIDSVESTFFSESNRWFPHSCVISAAWINLEQKTG